MSKCDYCDHVEMCAWREELNDDGCEFYSEGDQWIPVSERLPDKNGHYLVYAPTYRGGSSSAKENHDGIMFSRFSNGKWSIEHGYYERINCVIAWMPLPSSYQGE